MSSNDYASYDLFDSDDSDDFWKRKLEEQEDEELMDQRMADWRRWAEKGPDIRIDWDVIVS